MNLLLDTHAFLWFVEGDPRFSAVARRHVGASANVKWLSLASVWEMAIKISIGKLSLVKPLDEYVSEQCLTSMASGSFR